MVDALRLVGCRPAWNGSNATLSIFQDYSALLQGISAPYRDKHCSGTAYRDDALRLAMGRPKLRREHSQEKANVGA
jgi:hypothetical protein